MGIQILFEMFRDKRTPEQRATEEQQRAAARAAQEQADRRRGRIFLAKAFMAVAGTIGIIGGGGYWLGTHSTHSGQNNCATTNSPSLKP